MDVECAFLSTAPQSVNMVIHKVFLVLSLTAALALSGCSRQQSDWEKTRAANTTDAYELFLKKYPKGEFTAQAQARVKELYEERDWQKARDTDTLEAYQAFLKQYPEGKWTEEARIRVENFTLASAPSGATPSGTPPPGTPPAASDTAPPSQSTPATARPAKPAAPKPVASPKARAGSETRAESKSQGKSQGSYGIQLGAFKSGADAANKRWSKLEKEYPKVLSGLTPKVSPKKGASGTLYRLQVVSLSEKRANSICRELKGHSQACVLIH
jgi:cell division protein FtsN